MRLNRLELEGFKSFADRTVFNFGGQHLLGIVGPNGCGKSNVVDAVRWVLGETRPTSMRGEGMTDVIFKGSASRPEMSVAEVTLVIDNSDGDAVKELMASTGGGVPSQRARNQRIQHRVWTVLPSPMSSASTPPKSVTAIVGAGLGVLAAGKAHAHHRNRLPPVHDSSRLEGDGTARGRAAVADSRGH